MARADGTIDVYLISGFLGSGKTTFLNRLITVVPEDLTFLILMNEFGEVGLDGTLIEGDDVDMLEISKGSIFCACVKTDFIKALHALAKTVRPDIMLIETTGVAESERPRPRSEAAHIRGSLPVARQVLPGRRGELPGHVRVVPGHREAACRPPTCSSSTRSISSRPRWWTRYEPSSRASTPIRSSTKPPMQRCRSGIFSAREG